MIASGTWGRPVSLREEVEALNAGPDVAGWMARLAARGLPPDWTEEELRRQGYDLNESGEEDEGSNEEEEDEDGSGYPGETEDRGDGSGVAAAMLAQMAEAGVVSPAALPTLFSSYGLS